MSNYVGDIRLGDTLDVKFTTRQISGAPFTLAGSPVISAYPSNSTTQLTAGITLTVDFDSVTGYNNVRVVASGGNGYLTATNYDLCITTGTVNSVSVVGESIGSFSIENRSAVMPTTAARTLDVSAGGEAGLDWANIGSQTTAQNLSGTLIQAVNNLAAGSDSINTTATSGSTLTTGSTVSGTYASTAPLDGTYWQIADTAGTLDMYFEFNVGATGVPTTAVWTGGLTTAVNSLKVFAYNWGSASWDQVGALNGTTSLIINNAQYDFTTAHVGTGGNLGLVRLRFQNTGLTSANFYTDQVLCGYTNVQTFPSNFSAFSLDASGRVDVIKVAGTSQTAGDLKADTAAIKTQTDKLTFTVANVIDANMLRTNGDATAAANVAKTTRAIGRGTVTAGASTTSIPTSAFSPAGAAADQFKGRIITFDADTTTTALRGQSTDITASSNSATPTFTVTALTTAPANTDSFSVT